MGAEATYNEHGLSQRRRHNPGSHTATAPLEPLIRPLSEPATPGQPPPAQQAPSEPHPAAKRAAKGQGKAQHAFQRGLAALAQWMEQEGGQPPHKAVVALPEGTETKVGVWYANQKQRRYKLTEEQLEALRALGVQWA
nr:helicase associated domain-containing protein [Streptomyces sp. 2114.4]